MKDILKKIGKYIDFDEKTLKAVVETFEKHFIIGKDNKNKIVEELKDKLHIGEKEAIKIYDKVMNVIKNEGTKKLLNPLKNLFGKK